MAPTLQPQNSQPEKRPMGPPGARTAPQERKTDLVCRVKYCNTLPDIPFDTKFVTYPFDSTRFIQNNPTSLERTYKYEVLAEHDLGVTIDLINSDAYAIDQDAMLDPIDEKLLEEEVSTPQDANRKKKHSKSVSWLRRTEYISTEQTRFQPQTMEKVEAKVGYSVKKALKDETLYMDRDSQVTAIEKTFADSKITIEKHYSKPNVVPVEVLPVYPDFKMWKYACAQVIFDSDPAPVGRSVPAQIEEMSQAMIRGVMDESGEQFVAYFLPTEDTLIKRKQDQSLGMEWDDESNDYTYKMAREYNWTVKSKASKGYEENYFLVVRDDGVYFNELETRVRLNKRRQKQGGVTNTKLLVHHRPLNEAEHQTQRVREKALETICEEDDDEPMAEDDDQEKEQSDAEDLENESQEKNDEKMETDGEKSGDESNKSNSDKEGSENEGSDNEASGHEGSKKGSDAESGDEGSKKGSPAASPQGSKASSSSSSSSSGSASDSDSD
ncbi:RNA polymerase II-associated factor 1 homolog [Neocloeon triangulifer]|uniref:RNA polymerase II-associated factor 1 homolog n=1 Tax=Neocloeon triangulifer TaxID=2078957 RepID=UPI00286F830E|nr:RNA polymerase II-associated factor 1 homolog [Neocloeon triangulifer]